MSAAAYVNHGRWVVDCSRPDCTGAELAIPGEAFHCRNCGQLDTVTWPDKPADILAVLNLRPVPGTRNWFPAGHPLADAYQLPAGETVLELVAENAAHGIGEKGEPIPIPDRPRPPDDRIR